MRTGRVLLWSIGMVSACLFLFGTILDDHWLCLLFKPVPVLCMAFAVWRRARCARPSRRSYAWMVVVGLVFGAMGDFLLEIHEVTFLYGMIAFLVGHLAYVAAFVERGRRLKLVLALPFVVWGLWAGWFLTPHLGALRVPVLAYLVVIVAMMWRAAAFAASRRGGWKARRAGKLALVGAVLFGFSDTLIAMDKFHVPIEHVRYPIILTYWAAQGLIARSARG